MLNYRGDYWIAGAHRVDLTYEWLFRYKRMAYSRTSYLWFVLSLPFTCLTVMLGAGQLLAVSHPYTSQHFLHVFTAVLAVIMVVTLSFGFLAKRQESRPWCYRSVERSFELRLVLIDSIVRDREQLWEHRHAISEYLLFFSNDDTAMLGTKFKWRKEQLERRQVARIKAETLLIVMGVPMAKIETHFNKVFQDLKRRELESVENSFRLFEDQNALSFAASVHGEDPMEIMEDLEKTRRVILNPDDPIAREM